MAWDGFGTFNRDYNWVNDRDAAIDITASRMDAEFDNFAIGIQACVAKNGENTATANLPMGTFKHTNVGASAARTDYARVAEMIDGTHVAKDAGGVADAQTLTLTPAITAYVKYQRFYFIPVANNTGACTLDINGVGAKDIKLVDGTDPAADDLNASGIADVVYDGTNFVLVNPATFTATAAATWANKTLTSPAISDASFSGTQTGFAGNVTGNLTGNVTGDVTGDLTGNADTVSVNANLTGPVTSIGNATALASNSVTSSPLATASTGDTRLIGAGLDVLIPDGFYIMGNITGITLQFKDALSVWRNCSASGIGGYIFSNGTHMRWTNTTGGNITVTFRKLD